MTIPRARVRLAALLWIVLAIVVWNVVFDRVVVLAGRAYVGEASMAAREGRYLRIDDAMRPAIVHGIVLASAVAIPIGLFGVGAAIYAAYRSSSSM